MPRVNRRTFLSSLCTLGLTRIPAIGQDIQANSGRICLGLNGINYYAGYYPFLNAWKQGGPLVVAAGASIYDTSAPPGAANSAWLTFVDHNGELLKPLPSSVTAVHRVFYAPPIDGPASGFSRVGQQWVLKWDGVARAVNVAGAIRPIRQSNRIDWIWASDENNMWISFADLDFRNPPHNVRICEKRFEPLLDAGKLFNPDWLSKIRAASGIIRCMTWQSTNYDRNTKSLADLPLMSHYKYAGDARTPQVKGGLPPQIVSELARETQSHPWVCIPLLLGTRKLSSITSMTNASVINVTTTSNVWRNGDAVIPYGTNWPQVERSTFTVQNIDQEAGTLELAGINSTALPAYRAASGSLTSPINLESIEREVTLFAAHFRDNVPAPLMTYFEYGNELWNWIFSAPSWLAAQARGRFFADDNHRMAGYLAAHCMRVIKNTYGEDRRTRWRGVLATQTGNPDVTRRMLAGIDEYLAEFSIPGGVSALFSDLAVTGYWGGPLTKSNRQIISDWMDASENRWRAGEEPTQFSYFDRHINEDRADGRHTGNQLSLAHIQQHWRDQKAIADACGLSFIQYEGGNHDDPKLFDTLTEPERKRFMEFYRHSNHTQRDALTYELMFESFTRAGGRYPSKFVEAGAVTRFGAWGGLRHLQDDNPVWNAVVAFNNRL